MFVRSSFVATCVALMVAHASGEVDPTNPEGSPWVGRAPHAVSVGPYGPFGLSGPFFSQGVAPVTTQVEVDSAVLDSVMSGDRSSAGVASAVDTVVRAELDAIASAEVQARNAAAADPSKNAGVTIDTTITHQPLIHVKVRVVEVQRSDNLAISSVLDFITADGGGSPFGADPFDNTINGSRRRMAGINRFPVPGLIDVAGDGSGMLINLSSAHINWVASLLATDFNADTITAPQVTTLNGKTVQFRAGDWIPFSLGANLIQGDTNTIQEVFYRHVGTYIQVTPQIVNWGKNHEGLGQVMDSYATENPQKVLIRERDVYDAKVGMISLISSTKLHSKVKEEEQLRLQQYVTSFDRMSDGEKKIAAERLRTILNALIEKAGVTRTVLFEELDGAIAPPIVQPEALDCQGCNWKASDCTVNLNIAVRLSDPGTSEKTVTAGDGVVPVTLETERNVRAISNMVQVKSGRGVVLGGLITMRDVEQASKLPYIGDIPFVGAAFRSKETARVKTETLIFVEAEVLPSFDNCYDECGNNLVESQSARDFCDSKVHIQAGLCDGPLAQGMHRAGLQGDYLPPPSHGEREYWRYYHQTMRHLRHHRRSSGVRDIVD